jgi:hypothetical protein
LRLGAVILALLPVPVLANWSRQAAKPAQEPALAGPEDPAAERAGFSLGLADIDPSEQQPNGFRLGLEHCDLTAPDAPGSGTGSLPELSLSSHSNGRVGPQVLLGPDFAEELRQARWPDGVGRLEHMLTAELARGLSGGTPGACRAMGQNIDCSTGPLIDVIRVYKVIRKWWHTRKERRQPPGALVTRTQRATLQVREADGSMPEEINVLPLIQGWVADVIPASCVEGRCRVDGLPDRACTLLVRGRGAALVALHRFDVESYVVLRPVGWLRLIPGRPSDVEEPVRVRLVAAASGLTTPVIRWLNPERGETCPLPNRGLPLLLPEGEYRVEQRAGDGSIHSLAITVTPGRKTELVITPPAGIRKDAKAQGRN